MSTFETDIKTPLEQLLDGVATLVETVQRTDDALQLRDSENALACLQSQEVEAARADALRRNLEQLAQSILGSSDASLGQLIEQHPERDQLEPLYRELMARLQEGRDRVLAQERAVQRIAKVNKQLLTHLLDTRDQADYDESGKSSRETSRTIAQA